MSNQQAGPFWLLLRLLLSLGAITSVQALAAAPSSPSSPSRHYTLYDMPVSNHGARCRIIIYKKQLPVEIVPPSQLGGLSSPEYRKIHPQGKMPALAVRQRNNDNHDNDDDSPPLLCLAESDTIARYLLTEFAADHSQGPSFQLENPLSNMMARFHDTYLSPIQSCLYRAAPPFGVYGTRADAVDEYVRQCDLLAALMTSTSCNDASVDCMYLVGDEVSLADATIFPSCVFASYMLPKFDRQLPMKLQHWYDRLLQEDKAFQKVANEMHEALQVWETNGRWNNLLGAGWRDETTEQSSTIFDKIVKGDIPATIVYEDDKIMAIKDIDPAGPAHVLVFPKVRAGLERLSNATVEHSEILGRLLVAASEIVRNKELGFGDGARIVINDGPDGGQEIPHLHVHVIGGRQMNWPPG